MSSNPGVWSEGLVKESERFGRPVGGVGVVRDLCRYLRGSDDVAEVRITSRAGGSTRGPEVLLPSKDSEGALEKLTPGRLALRRRVTIDATFSQGQIDSIHFEVSRTWTRVLIEGQNRRDVAGERHEIAAVLSTPRRMAAVMRLLVGVVIAVASVTGVLLAIHP
jgi:hypothetical protein